MEGRVHMHWTKVLFLMGLMFMAIGLNVAQREVAISMDPCDQSVCENACKAILKGQFMSADCYKGKFCECHGG